MKILKGTLIGGIAYFLLGWLVYGILLMDFYSANMNNCANRPDSEMIWWAMIVSNFVFGLLLTLILKWSGAKGVVDGLKTGALFGFLWSVAINMSFWSMTTMYNTFGTLVADVVISTVLFAVIALFIVLLWGKEKATIKE